MRKFHATIAVAAFALLGLTACTPEEVQQAIEWSDAQAEITPAAIETAAPAVEDTIAEMVAEPTVETTTTVAAPVEQVGSTFAATCTALTVSVYGYDAATRFFIYTDGAPPYHLDMIEQVHTFPIHVVDFGITVINPDGTLTESPMQHNSSVC